MDPRDRPENDGDFYCAQTRTLYAATKSPNHRAHPAIDLLAEHAFGRSGEVKDRAPRDREAAACQAVLDYAGRPKNHSIKSSTAQSRCRFESGCSEVLIWVVSGPSFRASSHPAPDYLFARSFELSVKLATKWQEAEPMPETFGPRIFRAHHRYIAVCDVLGFSHLVTTRPLEYVATIYGHLLLVIGNVRRMTAFMGEEFVQAAIFSDTVLLYSRPIPPNAGVEYLADVSAFFDVCIDVMNTAFAESMPVRIGISYGPCFLEPDPSIFVGGNIVWAYEMEQKQDWIGGACDVSCTEAPHFERVSSDWNDVVSYDIPVKGGYEKGWALNWPKRAFHPEIDRLFWLRRDDPSLKHVRRKYAEAEKFLNLYRPNRGEKAD